MIQAIIGLIAGIGKGLFDDWNAKRENQRQIERAVAENKIRMALSEQEHNQAWEMAALAGGDKWLRRMSFFMWSGPLVWAYFSPEAARAGRGTTVNLNMI